MFSVILIMLGVLQRDRQTNGVFYSVYEIVEMLRQTKKDYFAANVTLLKYYLAHKYIDEMEINWFIDTNIFKSYQILSIVYQGFNSYLSMDFLVFWHKFLP